MEGPGRLFLLLDMLFSYSLKAEQYWRLSYFVRGRLLTSRQSNTRSLATHLEHGVPI